MLRAVLEVLYKKLHLHYLLPICVLVLYTLLGGFLFYSIEAPGERRVLAHKKAYIEREERALLDEVRRIQQRVRRLFAAHATTSERLRELRRYRPFALNRLNKIIYWYVLQVYYLNDQESYKSTLLHSSAPEALWKSHLGTSFGRIRALQNYTQQLSARCWEIGIDASAVDAPSARLNASLAEFNRFTGLAHVLKPTWTFWNAMFLAAQSITTIGYGNITAKTRLGKLVLMVYAVIGIPLVLMILHKLGHFCLLALESFWHNAVWFMESISCVKNADAEKLKGKVGHDASMPVLLAVGVAFGWMFLCSAIFLHFEREWTYFMSFYFFFCSLTTIGYGDLTPSRSEDMFLMFGLVIIGLSLVSMCVNVIQEKLEAIFEELLLLSMLEKYGTFGAGIWPTELTPKLSLIDAWTMWRRRQTRAQAPSRIGGLRSRRVWPRHDLQE